MYIFNTCLDFQSWFFDIYVYTHFAPFVSNIFTSKSVLTIAETHPVTHPPSRTPKNITTCHETHYIAWSIFSHFLPKKLMILRSFSSLLRWESVPGTLLVKKSVRSSDYRTFFGWEFSTPQQEWQHKPENRTLRKIGWIHWGRNSEKPGLPHVA